jgi:hypothetical protein
MRLECRFPGMIYQQYTFITQFYGHQQGFGKKVGTLQISPNASLFPSFFNHSRTVLLPHVSVA